MFLTAPSKDCEAVLGCERAGRMCRATALTLAVAIACALAWAPSGARADLPPGGLAPSLSLAPDGTVEWAPIGVESSYEIALSSAPRAGAGAARLTRYLTIVRAPGETQYYRPTVEPGQTVYVGVSADGGTVWSATEAEVGALGSGGASAGNPSEWSTAAARQAEVVAAQAPSATAGTASAGEAGAGEEGSEEAPPEARGGYSALSSSGPVIGTNDGAGWGAEAARRIIAGAITWDRVDIEASPSAVSTSLADGFKVLAIAGAVSDGEPLSQVESQAWGATVASQLASNPGITIAEAGNESYLKGGVANPVQYGRMYMAAIASMRARGLHVPLLFNMTGDYPHGTWASPRGWSEDAAGGGWLREAVKANPGLAGAILANGVSLHPYGGLGENVHDDWGVGAVAADEALAQTVLGSVPPVYVTEVGFDLSRCGGGIGACSPREQASKMRAAYSVLIADPHVVGIWWYQSHDDGTGHWGYMNDDGSLRPAFRTLSTIARVAGQ